MRTLIVIITSSLAAGLLAATTAAALTEAEKCESAKLKEAGKYGFCRLKAEAKAVKTAGTPDYSKCDEKFAPKWAGIEAGGMCPSSGDQAAVQGFIAAHSDDLAASLGGGGPLPDYPTCLATPKGQRVRTGQTLCYNTAGAVITCAGSGQDGASLKGLTISFIDNGDGTITDTRTGLMWEKLGDDGSIHDQDTIYTWSAAVSGKVATLNGGGGFAGHTDWRLPNIHELQSLVNYGALSPALHAPFTAGCMGGCAATACSCSQASTYWSSTTYQNFPSAAWYVSFFDGLVLGDDKTNGYYVRAVRGGS